MASPAMARGGRGKIRPPRRAMMNDATLDFDNMWESLSESLRGIHTKNASKLSFEELYRSAYKLVLKKRGDTLYERVIKFETDWLEGNVRPPIEGTVFDSSLATATEKETSINVNERRAEGEKFLRALKDAWEDHQLCMGMTTDVLMYMDRVYCRDFRRPSIFNASMALFRDVVLRAQLKVNPNRETSLADTLNAVILEQIQMDRQGDLIDHQLLKSCVHILEGLYETPEEDESTKLYLTTFEPQYLRASQEFYESEGKSLLQDADAGSFCRHARRRAMEEQDRCTSTISPLTQPKIKSVVEEELMKKHLGEIIGLPNSGVKFMLDNDRMSELEMIYDISSRVDPNKEQLTKAVQSHIVELGVEINRAAKSSPQPGAGDAKNENEQGEAKAKTSGEATANQQTVLAIKWVDDILILQTKYDRVLKDAFQSDQGLQTAFSRSFSEFINEFGRSSEYLSLFFDENMKKGIKGKTENEVDMLLDKGIKLLRYIQDKDLFERYYKKHLSKRLLMKRSVSRDAERQMISKMKLEVGNTFTNRIENMFRDMTTSEELSSGHKEFVRQLDDNNHARAELEVSVLTSTMWPLEAMNAPAIGSDPRGSCIYPAGIERLKVSFEKFYHSKHTGRQLTWQAHMGTADIRTHFPQMKGKQKSRTLQVSTYAMLILLLFQDLPASQSLTCEEIQAKTNIPLGELTRNLQSLAVASKTRILTKEPMSREVKPTDKFSFNESFHSNFERVKIGVVASGNRVEDSIERTETQHKIDESRKGVIEAAIVRIMKQRKELTHQVLIVEVISQLKDRFLPDVNMVKTRIEGLIEREYLERIEDREPPSYRYLA